MIPRDALWGLSGKRAIGRWTQTPTQNDKSSIAHWIPPASRQSTTTNRAPQVKPLLIFLFGVNRRSCSNRIRWNKNVGNIFSTHFLKCFLNPNFQKNRSKKIKSMHTFSRKIPHPRIFLYIFLKTHKWYLPFVLTEKHGNNIIIKVARVYSDVIPMLR